MRPSPREISPSPRPESLDPGKASFSSLPLELRQKIWLLTLQPRVLYLHIHQRLEPPRYDEDGFIDGFRKIVSLSYTAQVATLSLLPSEAFSEYASFVAPDPTILDVDLGNDGRYHERYANVLATRPFSIKNSRGPVALEVSSESREWAMRRYELAFAGTNLGLEPKDREEWDRKGFGEKRIWVDFEQDIIFVDAMWRVRKYSKCAPLNPLGLLREYAPEESKKTHRLALGTSWASGIGGSEIMKALHGSKVPKGENGQSLEGRWEWFWGFNNVEELLVNDFFKRQRNESDLGVVGWLEDENTVAMVIEEAMTEGREDCPEWTAEVPRVKVVRGSAWAAYIEWP
jgi:hypothetical protein